MPMGKSKLRQQIDRKETEMKDGTTSPWCLNAQKAGFNHKPCIYWNCGCLCHKRESNQDTI